VAAISAITVKNSANVDVIFSPLRGAAGDKATALWRVEDAALPMGMRVTLAISTQDNGPKTARRLIADCVVPVTYTDPATGLPAVLARIPAHLEVTLPTNVASSLLADRTVMQMNAFASTAVKAMLASGYADN